jgi:hypothetical protein
MAYDQSTLMGLDSLSPTVSAYKNFIQQKDKVSDANIVPFLLSRGEPQLAGLIAKKLRLENATKQQQQMTQQPPSAPPTVAQQYDMAAQQQMAPRPPMQPAGVAAMPNPTMSRASFAGGGIVAFNGEQGSQVREISTGEFLFPGAYTDGELEPWAAGIANALTPRSSGRTIIRQAQQLRNAGRVQEAMQLLAANRIDPRQAFGSAMPRQPTATPTPVREAAAPAPAAGFVAPDSKGSLFDQAIDRARTGVSQGNVATPRAAPAESDTGERRVAARRPAQPTEDPYAKFLPPEPKTEEQLRSERIAREKEQGVGEFSKALQEEKTFIEDRRKKFGEDEKNARKDFWVMLGASLLGNKSPYFSTALGESVKENYGNLTKDLRQLKKDQDALRLQEIQLRRVQEQAMATGSKEDRAEAQRLQTEYRTTGLAIQTQRDNVEQKVLDRAVNLEIAKLRNQTGQDDRIGRLTRLQDAVNEEGISAEEKARRKAALEEELSFQGRATRATVGTAYASEVELQGRREALQAKLLQNPRYTAAQSILTNPNASPQEIERAQRVIQAIEASAAASPGLDIAPTQGYVPSSSNVRNPYAGKSDEEIMRMLGQ